jgi:hypothetical protein
MAFERQANELIMSNNPLRDLQAGRLNFIRVFVIQDEGPSLSNNEIIQMLYDNRRAGKLPQPRKMKMR